MKNWKQKILAFTVVEMLVVMTILGILTIGSVQYGRRHFQNARNATRTQIVGEYIRAFQRVLADNGQKFFANNPNINPEFKAVCLGEYENDTCWVNNQQHRVDHDLNAKIRLHLDNLPTILTDGVRFEGILYHCLPIAPGSPDCDVANIYWFMEDLENETALCTPGWQVEEYNEVYDGDVDGITFCNYGMTNNGQKTLAGTINLSSDWSPWSQCSAECDNETRSQFRTRECKNTAHGFDATCPDGGGIYEEQECNGAQSCGGVNCGSRSHGETWSINRSCVAGYRTETRYDSSSGYQDVDVPIDGTRTRVKTCTNGSISKGPWTPCIPD